MTCPSQDSLVAYVDGEVSHNASQDVLRHLAECASCSATTARLSGLQRRLRLAVPAGPDATFTREVLGRLTTASSARGTAPWRQAWVPAMALSAAMVLAVLVVQPLRARSDGAFTARGGSSAPSAERTLGFAAEVHRGGSTGPTAALAQGHALREGDGLSFTLYNRSHAPQRFLLFAVDAHRELHWFYPAYLSEGTDPASLPLAATPEVTRLSEGVLMDHAAPGPLQVVALFVPSDVHVRQVEAALQKDDVDSLVKHFPGASVQVLQLQLTAAPQGH